MSIKFNNTITIKLTDKQTDFLINLMNEDFCIDSISDAIKYCINVTEIHYEKMKQKNR